MKKTGLLLVLFLMLGSVCILRSAEAVIDSSVVYRLYHWESPSWAEYLPGSSLPSGSTIWKYEYTLYNGSSATTDIAWWHASFPYATGYSSLVDYGGPTGWANIVEGPEVWGWWNKWSARVSEGGLGSTYYVSPGQSQSGYWVEFDWSGCTLPGDQHYEASNEDSESGWTTPVPEPTSMLLLGIGLIGLAGRKVRKRFKA